MEQPIKKKKILTLPDLAFGFVYKRSGNEIMLCLETDWNIRIGTQGYVFIRLTDFKN